MGRFDRTLATSWYSEFLPMADRPAHPAPDPQDLQATIPDRRPAPDAEDLQATVPAQGWDQAQTVLAAAPASGSGPSTDETLPANLNLGLDATVITRVMPSADADATVIGGAPTVNLHEQATVVAASGSGAPTQVASGTGSGSRTHSLAQTGSQTASGLSGSFTRGGTRMGRTRINNRLQPTEQDLDARLQLSRTSVLTDMTAARGADAVPGGLQKLVDDQGTDARYHINRPLAAGGMGAVLDIQDNDFRRGAAMKVIHGRFADDPQALERFLAEAQVTAQLEHPNIVPIHDMGVMADGTLYFTMKLIEGFSLGDLVKLQRLANGMMTRDEFVKEKEKKESAKPAANRKTAEQITADYEADVAKGHKLATRFTRDEILLTFLKVLDGVGFAHSRGVVHRDIKPDNIMLGAHGEVLVVDWGIAKVLKKADRDNEFVKRIEREVVSLRDADAISATMTGSAMGTLFYMPPEQARGELDLIDGRSDIYALGATLYELLCLKRCLEAKSMAEALAAITTGDWIPLDRVRPDLDKDLIAVVHRSMALDPARRYATCSDFADDIRRFLAGQAVVARQRNLIERIGAWVAAHKRQVQFGAAATALVVVAVGGTKYYVDQGNLANGNTRLAEAGAKFQSAKAAADLAGFAEALQVLEGAKLLLTGDPRPLELSQEIKVAQSAAQREAAAVQERQNRLAAARKNFEEATRLKTEGRFVEAETLLTSALGQDSQNQEYDQAREEVRKLLNNDLLRKQTEQARALRVTGDEALAKAAVLDRADDHVVALLDTAKKAYDELEKLPQIEGSQGKIQALTALRLEAEAARGAKLRAAEAGPFKAKAKELLTAAKFVESRAALAQAKGLTPEDRELDQILQGLITAETLAKEEEKTKEARKLADEALVMAAGALQAGNFDEALVKVELAFTHIPGEPKGLALQKTVTAAKAVAERSARLAKASAAADEALSKVKEAQQLVSVKSQQVIQLQSQIDHLGRELGKAPVDRQAPLFAAVAEQKAARAVIAEQWALAEGLANGALSSLADFPAEPKNAEVRKALCQLYLSRLRDARKTRSLAEINAFANLIRRFDREQNFSRELANLGEITVSGATVSAKRLSEGSDTRLVPSGEPIALEAGKTLSLEAGGYQLTAGDMTMAVTVVGGQNLPFTWPSNLPKIDGLPLAYVPPHSSQQGFMLAVTETTVAQYGTYLNSPEFFPTLAARHKQAFEAPAGTPPVPLPHVPGEYTTAADGANIWVPNFFRMKGVDARLDALIPIEPDKPISKMSREDAEAYCAWLSKKTGLKVRLPKAKEWSFAGNGGDDRRTYPWGSFFVGQFTASSLSVGANAQATPVASFAADVGPFGHHDLAGNLREWLGDTEADGPLAAGANGGLIAGGSFSSDNPITFTTTYVESVEPDKVFSSVIGFRVLVELP